MDRTINNFRVAARDHGPLRNRLAKRVDIMPSGPRVLYLLLLTTVLLGLAAQAVAAVPGPAALVPRPAKVDWQKGYVPLDSATSIIFSNEAAQGEAEMLATLLRPATGLPLPVQPMPPLGGKLGNAIVLTLDPGLENRAGQGRLQAGSPSHAHYPYRRRGARRPLLRRTDAATTPAGGCFRPDPAGRRKMASILLPH